MYGSVARLIGIGAAAVLGVSAAGGSLPAHAQANSALVFDASNSMNSRFDGGTRLDALKESVARIAPAFAGRLNLATVAFGHRQEVSCRDIETLVSVGPNGPSRAGAAVQNLSAKGVSPLGNSVERAANELSFRQKSASIVVVADSAGIANCRVNTCTLASELKSQGADLVIHVVALGAKPEEIPNLQCMATATGGRFASARSRAELGAALTAAFTAAAAQEQKAVLTDVPAPRPKPKRTAAAATAPQQQPEEQAPTPPQETAQAPTPAPPQETVQTPAATQEQQIASADVTYGAVRPRPKPSQQAGGAAGSASGTGDNVSVFAPTARVTDTEGAAAAPTETVMAPSGSGPRTEQAANQSTFLPSGTSDAAPPPTTTGATQAPVTVTAAPSEQNGEQTDDTIRIARTDDGLQVSETPPSPSGTTTLMRRETAASQARARAAAPAASDSGVQAASQQAAAQQPVSDAAEQGRIKLSGYIVEGTKPVPSGMAWQVVAPNTGEVVARSSESSPELSVPAGTLEVRAAFGHAIARQTVSVEAGQTADASVVMNAGGLQIIPLNAGAEQPGETVLNSIFRADDTSDPVVKDSPSGKIIYLNAGTYRVESRFGTNAVATANITVQPGKLVKAKINHRAGPAAFRLVPETGGDPLSGAIWQVMTNAGQVVTQSRDATPDLVFAEGAYDVVVQHDGKTYRSAFVIKPGEPTNVEIVAR